MSTHNALFKTDKAKNFVINKPEISRIGEYKKLWDKDTGKYKSKPNREKELATKWFFYIYLVCDIRSMYSNLSESDRKEKAIKDCDFPEGYEFKEDADIKNAMKRYKKDVKLSSTAKAFLTADKALSTMGDNLNFIQEQLMYNKKLLMKTYNSLKDKEEFEAEDEGLFTQSQALMEKIMSLDEKATSLIAKFNPAKKNADELLSKYLEEEGMNRELHGGGELGNREEA